MAKLTLNDLANLQNENSAVAAINANNSATEAALEITLSRDGTAPNQMLASLDMNSNRILNLPAPIADQEPLRKIDVDNSTLLDMEELRDEALASQVASLASQVASAGSATAASSSATNAATSASASSTSASAALASQTAAASSASAASTSATAAASSASSASTSATTATTQASAASTSATNAASSASSASTSATTATTQASNASTSATNAATSATTASTQATNAATSATSAATSATSAVAALQSVAFKYTWSTSTSGDPGSGKIAVNNATVASATAMQISETDANSNSISATIAAWGANANTNGRARVKIAKDATNFIILTITSAVTDAGAYDTFVVSSGVLTGTISNGDTVYVAAALSGLDGVGGDFSSNTSSSVDSEIVLFSSTGGKTGKRATTTGILKGTSGVLSAATAGTDYVAPATATTFTATQGYAEVALTYTSGGTTAWDCSTAQVATVAMASGNSTMGAPTNVTAGRFYSYRIVQDSTPRTMAWNAAYKFANGTAPTISTGSGAVDHFIFYGRTSNVLEEIGRNQAVA